MEALYHQTNRLVQETQQCFQGLDRLPPNADEIENDIQSRIHQITSNCEKLDIMIFKAPVSQRHIAKMKCDQIKYDNRHMQAALGNYQSKRLRQAQERQEREQLLSRRLTGNDTAVTVDMGMKENVTLQNSHRGVDEMLSTGSNILDSLRNQRETLKGAHRRIIDLANTLGLSNATISLIEKRASQDKFVLFGGMIVTLGVIALIIIYVA